jgi:hypothetical protein
MDLQLLLDWLLVLVLELNELIELSWSKIS